MKTIKQDLIKKTFSVLIISGILGFSVHSPANEESLSLLDIEPASELQLNLSFPKSLYNGASAVKFRFGEIDKSNSSPYEIGEYCEIYFKNDPTSMFSKSVNIKRNVKIKFVNEAWTHSPGESMPELAKNYRTGNNIWLEDDLIQRISCYLVEDESSPLSNKEIEEIALLASGRNKKDIPFLIEEMIHYRLTLSHLKRHLGTGVVSLNNTNFNDLNYWDQNLRKTLTDLRKQIKTNGRKKYMQDEDEKAKLAMAVNKLIKIEGTYRRNFGVLPTESLEGNSHYDKFVKEEMEKQNFPQDIQDLVNGK